MTANKNFKRRVRARTRKTGESYTAARRHLTFSKERAMPETNWQRVEKPEFGYAVEVPEGWQERQPNLKNSPWETARFVPSDDRRRGLTVFRMVVRSGQTALGVAEGAQTSLAATGFGEFELTEDVRLGGVQGARLRCAKWDAGRIMAVREDIVVIDKVGFCAAFNSFVPDDDESVFDAIAERFEVL